MLYQAAKCLMRVEVLASPVMEISLGNLFQYLITVLIVKFLGFFQYLTGISLNTNCPLAVYHRRVWLHVTNYIFTFLNQKTDAGDSERQNNNAQICGGASVELVNKQIGLYRLEKCS